MGVLYIVATPIGNLADITYRAVETLKSVDMIFAEDVRVTKRLLDHYSIDTDCKSYDEHNHDKVSGQVIELLGEGKSVALVSDAGTPGIADPGNRLVDLVKAGLQEAQVIAIPGPSALTAALSAAGVVSTEFVFKGFPPHKKGRSKFFDDVLSSNVSPVVFYESSHRLQKALESLPPTHPVVVASELTKIHEEVFRGTAEEALVHFKGDAGKGEFVIIVP